MNIYVQVVPRYKMNALSFSLSQAKTHSKLSAIYINVIIFSRAGNPHFHINRTRVGKAAYSHDNVRTGGRSPPLSFVLYLN